MVGFNGQNNILASWNEYHIHHLFIHFWNGKEQRFNRISVETTIVLWFVSDRYEIPFNSNYVNYFINENIRSTHIWCGSTYNIDFIKSLWIWLAQSWKCTIQIFKWKRDFLVLKPFEFMLLLMSVTFTRRDISGRRKKKNHFECMKDKTRSTIFTEIFIQFYSIPLNIIALPTALSPFNYSVYAFFPPQNIMSIQSVLGNFVRVAKNLFLWLWFYRSVLSANGTCMKFQEYRCQL